jgi:hypothetical protein
MATEVYVPSGISAEPHNSATLFNFVKSTISGVASAVKIWPSLRVMVTSSIVTM